MTPLPFLLRNPLTMQGLLDRCWLFAYRTSPAEARCHLPAPLEPVIHGGHAYWNVVVSHISAMRPLGIPPIVGVSYWHVAYRLYVRLPVPGRPSPREGLYFVRSDSDNPLMTLAGNLLTDFRFHTATIRVAEETGRVAIRIDSSTAPGEVRLERARPSDLPPGSPFATVEAAAAALKYRPFGISVDPAGRRAGVVRIVRDESAWRAQPVVVEHARWAFFEGKAAVFELGYEVEPIPYQWNRGRVVRLRP